METKGINSISDPLFHALPATPIINSVWTLLEKGGASIQLTADGLLK